MPRAATLHAPTTKGGSTMYRKHVANFLLASSLALGVAPLASAQPMPGGMGRGGHPMKQVRRARTELRQVAAAERFDEGRARQIADTQAKALATLAVMRAQSMHR